MMARKFLNACLFAGAVIGFAGIAHADGLRPSVATPLQAAERDLSAHNFAAASKALKKAQAVPDKTAFETLTIDKVRAAIDAGRQDFAAAASDYATLIASGGLAPDEVHTMAEAEASSDYQAGNYSGAIATIKAYLPGDPQFHTILLQSYLKTNDCADLNKAAARSARIPPEADLQMVAYCDASTKDTAGYTQAMQKLVQYYPNPTYWSQFLGVAQANPEYSGSLALDFFRLKLAVGMAPTADEYMDMTQAALQAGLANEATTIINQGFSSGVLGTGPDADRQSRLKALAIKRQAATAASVASQTQTAQAAQDEPTLFSIGFNRVDGGDAGGLQMMADAIRSGKLTHPDQAELELGIAYRKAGQVANADAMFRNVQGGGGAADLGKLWLYVR